MIASREYQFPVSSSHVAYSLIHLSKNLELSLHSEPHANNGSLPPPTVGERRHRRLARRGIAVRRRALVVAEGERPRSTLRPSRHYKAARSSLNHMPGQPLPDQPRQKPPPCEGHRSED